MKRLVLGRSVRALGWAAVGAIIALGAASCVSPGREVRGITPEALAGRGLTHAVLTHGATHYEFCADGDKNQPIVVLVHGGTLPMWVWDKQFKALMEDGFRVLRYDMYGRGYSARPEDVVYDRDLYRTQLEELLENVCPEEEVFDLVGVSMGAGTAVDFVARSPARARKLVLVSPVVNGVNKIRSKRLKACPPALGPCLVRCVGVQRTVNRAAAFLTGKELGEGPTQDPYIDRFIEQTTIAGYRTSLRSMVCSDALGDYRSAYAKAGEELGAERILMLWAKDDEDIAADMIEQARNEIAGLNVITFDEGGHGLMFRRAADVNKELLPFLRK